MEIGPVAVAARAAQVAAEVAMAVGMAALEADAPEGVAAATEEGERARSERRATLYAASASAICTRLRPDRLAA